jgi:hypothetical protein
LQSKFTLLQSIFSRQIFLLYFVKGKFGGKNLLFKRVNLLCKEVFAFSKYKTKNWREKIYFANEGGPFNLNGIPTDSK